jgi:hypothetical protein
LNDVLGSLLHLYQLHPLLGSLAKRLFDVNVFARSQRIKDHAMVPVFGSPDEHHVDILVGQQVLVIAIGLGMVAGCFGGHGEGVFKIRFVDIANAANLHGRVLLEHGHDEGSAAAATDKAHHDLVGRSSLGGKHGVGAKEKSSSVGLHESFPKSYAITMPQRWITSA